MEKTLLERQVEALRASIEPGRRWDRLASGEMGEDEESEECALCEIERTGDCMAYCPLAFAWKKQCYAMDTVYFQWNSALAESVNDYNAPTVVALAREIKALLARLLVEYEAKLKEERKNA